MTPARQGLTLLGAAGLFIAAVLLAGCLKAWAATFPTYYDVTVNPGDESSAAWVCVKTDAGAAELFCADLEKQLKEVGAPSCPLRRPTDPIDEALEQAVRETNEALRPKIQELAP